MYIDVFNCTYSSFGFQFGFWMLFPGGHAASICDNTPEAICRVLEEEEVTITTKLVSSNPAHGVEYLIQLSVIKFVSDHWLATGMWLSLTSSTNKTDHHAYDITDILLKVALNIITNMSKNVIEISVEHL
jgi:hypothetical protein